VWEQRRDLIVIFRPWLHCRSRKMEEKEMCDVVKFDGKGLHLLIDYMGSMQSATLS
jgi:hypothetical protein